MEKRTPLFSKISKTQIPLYKGWGVPTMGSLPVCRYDKYLTSKHLIYKNIKKEKKPEIKSAKGSEDS